LQLANQVKAQLSFNLLDGVGQVSEYHYFSGNHRKLKSIKFEFLFGNNRISKDIIELDLPNVKGKINFTNSIS
jgi:hypothetical protein